MTSLNDFHEVYSPLGLYQSARFLHLELDITNRCNIRCVMCYHSLEATRAAKTVHMTPDRFEVIADRLLPYAQRLSLSLGNEPLMSPYFSDILRVAARHRVPHVNFFTNGLLFDEEKIGAVIESGVTQVCVSIDAATEGTYRSIRRDGDFNRLLRNVRRLLSRRADARRAAPTVRFDVVMMKRNVHELDGIVHLAARLGVDELSFRHLVSFDGLDMQHESLTGVRALSNYWLGRALESAKRFGIAVETRPAFFGEPPAAPRKAIGPFAPKPYCPYPFFHISVGPGGHVLPCPHAHGEEPYGQVSASTPIDDIWLGPRFTALRQRILASDPPAMCRRCPFLADRHPDVAELFVTRKH